MGKIVIQKKEKVLCSETKINHLEPYGWFIYYHATIESTMTRTTWFLHRDGTWRKSPMLGNEPSGYYKKEEDAKEMVKKHPR